MGCDERTTSRVDPQGPRGSFDPRRAGGIRAPSGNESGGRGERLSATQAGLRGLGASSRGVARPIDAGDRMTWPTHFAYPSEPHQRKHGPAGYTNYEEYKPWLRDEFTFRCVYCLERELWYPDRAA